MVTTNRRFQLEQVEKTKQNQEELCNFNTMANLIYVSYLKAREVGQSGIESCYGKYGVLNFH